MRQTELVASIHQLQHLLCSAHPTKSVAGEWQAIQKIADLTKTSLSGNNSKASDHTCHLAEGEQGSEMQAKRTKITQNYNKFK
jgi:hypothetical protein